MTKAFLAVKGSSSAASSSVREQILSLTDNVQKSLDRRFNQGNSVHIEEIQDQASALSLMKKTFPNRSCIVSSGKKFRIEPRSNSICLLGPVLMDITSNEWRIIEVYKPCSVNVTYVDADCSCIRQHHSSFNGHRININVGGPRPRLIQVSKHSSRKKQKVKHYI